MSSCQHLTIHLPQIAQTLDFTCGAACFESMFRFFRGQSLGEIYFAKLLKTFELGYTPPENIVELAIVFGFHAYLKRGVEFYEIEKAICQNQVVFVTWWDEDAGHYSLVKDIRNDHITLMDPWLAREQKDNTLRVTDFKKYWAQRGSVIVIVSPSVSLSPQPLGQCTCVR
ncbi:MAG: hypothetical protein JNL11_17765 [Bdellovibrionaceae bacterium]|nr:hypothetical protein [Pseudobdellovibrionaceae bacterium]